MDLQTFPDKIRVSGLPLAFHGWNTVFKKVVGETSGNSPVYRLEPYRLYFIIPLLGVTIKKKAGLWCFFRDDVKDPFFKNSKLIGEWNISIHIYGDPKTKNFQITEA